MHPSEPVLAARGLRVPLQGDPETSLRAVDFELYPGEILALLGLDTGSQTLLIDALLNLHWLAEGKVRILGLPASDPLALDRVGTVRRRVGFPASLKVRDVIRLVQAHFSRPVPLDDLLARFSMAGTASQFTGDLSYEQVRWLALLLAFAGDPDLILLDHPTVGMDLSWRVRLWDHIRDFVADGGAAVVSTHLSQEAEQVASRIIAFQHGEVLASGTPAQITNDSQLKRIWFQADEVPYDSLDGFTFVQRAGYWTVDTDDPDHVIHCLQRDGVEWRNLRVDPGDLHSALLHLGKQDDAG